MTNGEKFKQTFPNYHIDMGELYVYVWLPNHDAVDIPHDWWNAEYKEPTTKNDLALIHTEGLDEGIRCAMCTNSMANDLGCDGNCKVNNAMYKKVMDVIENQITDTDKMIEPTTPNDCETCIHNKGVLECDMYGCKYEPTTKNDLGVDAVSRDAVLDLVADYDLSMGQVVRGIHALPLVTSQESRKGHWISTETKGVRYAFWCRYKCSLCGGLSDRTNFCPNCGARMVEPQESEEKE